VLVLELALLKGVISTDLEWPWTEMQCHTRLMSWFTNIALYDWVAKTTGVEDRWAVWIIVPRSETGGDSTWRHRKMVDAAISGVDRYAALVAGGRRGGLDARPWSVLPGMTSTCRRRRRRRNVVTMLTTRPARRRPRPWPWPREQRPWPRYKFFDFHTDDHDFDVYCNFDLDLGKDGLTDNFDLVIDALGCDPDKKVWPWPWGRRPCRIFVEELGHTQNARHAVNSDLQSEQLQLQQIRSFARCTQEQIKDSIGLCLLYAKTL